MEKILPEDLRIVKMTSEHLADVYEVSVLSFPIAWSFESLERELENKLATYIVALHNGKAIGFGGVWVIFDESHITNIAVHPDHRGFGIGSILMNALLKTSYSKGARDITLEVRSSNTVAQNLYEKFGFIKEGIRKKYYQDNGEDAVIMWKKQSSRAHL